MGKKKLSKTAEADGKATGTQLQIKAPISAVLDKAVEWDLLPINPTTGVKAKSGVVKRDGFLKTDKLPKFF